MLPVLTLLMCFSVCILTPLDRCERLFKMWNEQTLDWADQVPYHSNVCNCRLPAIVRMEYYMFFTVYYILHMREKFYYDSLHVFCW